MLSMYTAIFQKLNFSLSRRGYKDVTAQNKVKKCLQKSERWFLIRYGKLS